MSYIISLNLSSDLFLESWNLQTGNNARIWKTEDIKNAQRFSTSGEAARALEAAKTCGYLYADTNLLIDGSLNCSKSPTFHCCYNNADDPMHDSCIYCEEPEERK